MLFYSCTIMFQNYCLIGLWIDWSQVLKSDRGSLVTKECEDKPCQINPMENQLVIKFARKLSYADSKASCLKLSGEFGTLPSIASLNASLGRVSLNIGNDDCGVIFWSRIKLSDLSYWFEDIIDGQVNVTDIEWDIGQPNGIEVNGQNTQKCAGIHQPSGVWDMTCVHKVCSLCTIKKTSKFFLRGLSNEFHEYFDSEYWLVPRLQTKNDQIMLEGVERSSITWSFMRDGKTSTLLQSERSNRTLKVNGNTMEIDGKEWKLVLTKVSLFSC